MLTRRQLWGTCNIQASQRWRGSATGGSLQACFCCQYGDCTCPPTFCVGARSRGAGNKVVRLGKRVRESEPPEEMKQLSSLGEHCHTYDRALEQLQKHLKNKSR